MAFDLKIIHLALQTGFSYKAVFGHLRDVLKHTEDGYIGVADEENTFAHPAIERFRDKNKLDVKVIYGVRLPVVENAAERVPPRGQYGAEYIFIARNQAGLEEIYNLVDEMSKNFYYRGNISYKHVRALSDNVIVIAENFHDKRRIDFIGLSPRTPRHILKNLDIPVVALCHNFYPRPENKETYELLCAPNHNTTSYPQHIMNTDEYIAYMLRKGIDMDTIECAIENTHYIAKDLCEPFRLRKAPMVRSIEEFDLEYLCEIGADKRGVNIKDGPYAERYKYEMRIIKEKDFEHYFLIVSDMVRWAKKRMFVGPSRGSSAGSLVCWLCGITEIDPIKFDLLFERFIDINRSDLPDIDIDFPDDKREQVLDYMLQKYGSDNVKKLATISTMQPRIAISEWAKGLRIPEHETDELKDAIIFRASGDARAEMCLADTFTTTDVGKKFIEEYPKMLTAQEVEEHPRHQGVHAAGVIVSNEPLKKYAGVSSRENHEIIMMDKRDAEYLGLLKIDALGLRTLGVLFDFCEQIKMDFRKFYTMPLDDKKAYDIFASGNLEGIFQFEGNSVANLTKNMQVDQFEDIAALTSLARPGALYSGGAARYVKYRNGEEDPVFISDKHKEITRNTFGIIVYQEQMLRLCREVAMMTWEEVNALRRALSKSLGKEYFAKFKDSFLKGSIDNGYSEEDADFLWGEIENGGAYAFNKSHAVAYGLISYWCAWAKAHHPLEFLVANLRGMKDHKSALKMLRYAVEKHGIKYVPVDIDESELDWSVKNGVVVGGLVNIKGIGVKKAHEILKARSGEKKLSKGMITKLMGELETPFDVLYPCKHLWGDIYRDPRKYELTRKVSLIENVRGKGKYVFIGQLVMKNVRDLNEYINLIRRGGKVLETDNLMLAIRLEDDTDVVMCNVNRFRYEAIGRDVAEHGIVDETWYIVEGEIKGEGRYVEIIDIVELTKDKLEE